MKEQLEAILTNSALDAEDQELWREYLKWAAPFFMERFVELFKDDVSDLPDATLNLRQKIAAADDQELQRVILDQELKTLEAFFKTN